ncbi:MAG: hypothetical protein PHS07_00860 [Patescibacteria group bacterium]|nr:hypothetical protein [Patescibacteria group bacterium]
MLETSKDVLYLVIAFCVLWLTIFMCWTLYYFLITIKTTKEIFQTVKERVYEVSDLIKTVKNKIERIAVPFTVVAETVKQIVPLIKKFTNSEEQKDKKTKTTNKKKK